MNKKITLIILCGMVITSYAFLSGCIGGTDNANSVHYDYIVDDDFSDSIEDWNITRFNSIQSAINICENDSKILVKSGEYFENIRINKPLEMHGEDVSSTIIIGESVTKDIIYIDQQAEVVISGFTIRDNGVGENNNFNQAGIEIHSNNNTISENIFEQLSTAIYSKDVTNNTIRSNVFKDSREYGIYLYQGSNENNVFNNYFTNNSYSLRIKGSRLNTIYNNIFTDNTRGIYVCCGSAQNTIYSNIFEDNFQYNVDDHYSNKYDNDEIGNYWDDNTGNDTNNDGIIDTPYSISNGSNEDRFPLVKKPDITVSILS